MSAWLNVTKDPTEDGTLYFTRGIEHLDLKPDTTNRVKIMVVEIACYRYVAFALSFLAPLKSEEAFLRYRENLSGCRRNGDEARDGNE